MEDGIEEPREPPFASAGSAHPMKQAKKAIHKEIAVAATVRKVKIRNRIKTSLYLPIAP
jgi:hypothetical protein